MSRKCSLCNEFGRFMFPFVDDRGCQGVMCEGCLAKTISGKSFCCDRCKKTIPIEGLQRCIYHEHDLSLCVNCYHELIMKG